MKTEGWRNDSRGEHLLPLQSPCVQFSVPSMVTHSCRGSNSCPLLPPAHMCFTCWDSGAYTQNKCIGQWDLILDYHGCALYFCTQGVFPCEFYSSVLKLGALFVFIFLMSSMLLSGWLVCQGANGRSGCRLNSRFGLSDRVSYSSSFSHYWGLYSSVECWWTVRYKENGHFEMLN